MVDLKRQLEQSQVNIERKDRYQNVRDERERNDRNARKHNRQNDDRWESDARNHSRRGHSERDLRRTDRYEENGLLVEDHQTTDSTDKVLEEKKEMKTSQNPLSLR